MATPGRALAGMMLSRSPSSQTAPPVTLLPEMTGASLVPVIVMVRFLGSDTAPCWSMPTNCTVMVSVAPSAMLS